VNPTTAGDVNVSLPGGRCFDAGGNGNSPSNTLTVAYVPSANRAPVVAGPGNQSSLRGAIVSLQIEGSDPDGQPLTWSATGLPPGLAMNTSTGLIGGTVALSAAASYDVTVAARDALNLGTTITFTWTVTSPASNGIRGEYFAGISPGGASPLLTRVDPKIDFDWGSGSPGGLVPVDMFSVRWTADLVPAFTETHTLTIAGDNGYRLWVGDTLVIDNWLPIGAGGWRHASVNLTAGQRTPVRLEYYEEWGGAGISFYWNSARQPWEAVPASRLIPPVVLPSAAGTLLPAISSHYDIGRDPAGGTIITFSRPLTTGSAFTLLESSADLRTWQTSDLPATITRTAGADEIRIRALEAPHVHPDGTIHQHTGNEPQKFFRVRIAEE
jgi:hypothetical protein